MKKMQSSIRYAVENADDVDAIVAEMESGGEGWKRMLHVSVLETHSEGSQRTSFPDDHVEVKSI
jgi:hypothetical protein